MAEQGPDIPVEVLTNGTLFYQIEHKQKLKINRSDFFYQSKG